MRFEIHNHDFSIEYHIKDTIVPAITSHKNFNATKVESQFKDRNKKRINERYTQKNSTPNAISPYVGQYVLGSNLAANCSQAVTRASSRPCSLHA